jgi:hypothetical protein
VTVYVQAHVNSKTGVAGTFQIIDRLPLTIHRKVQGRDEHWEAGDVLHVPPAMYEHEHYNNSSHACKQLRIQFGIRYWFTDIWPEGYTAQRIYDEAGQPITSGPIDSLRHEEHRVSLDNAINDVSAPPRKSRARSGRRER